MPLFFEGHGTKKASNISNTEIWYQSRDHERIAVWQRKLTIFVKIETTLPPSESSLPRLFQVNPTQLDL